jgi:hypothetical protein
MDSGMIGRDSKGGTLRLCENFLRTPAAWILRLVYCLIYCLFWAPTGGYMQDRIGYIDSVLRT